MHTNFRKELGCALTGTYVLNRANMVLLYIVYTDNRVQAYITAFLHGPFFFLSHILNVHSRRNKGRI